MSEHKKCPFCGGKALIESVEKVGVTEYFSICTCCAAEGPWHTSEAAAWAAWNRRDDAAVKALVEEHRTWAQEFGAALVLALQGDYSKIDDLAHDLIIDFPAGAPSIRSEAIKKAEGL